MLSSKVLSAADQAVNVDRQGVYGHPYENFNNIATLWKGYKGVEFSRQDVAMMMILVKVARLKNTPGHTDSLIDIAGYVKTAELILEKELNIMPENLANCHHFYPMSGPFTHICTQCGFNSNTGSKLEKLPTETGRFDSNRQNLTPPPRENSL